MSRNAEPRRRLSEASGGAGGGRSDGEAEVTSHRSVPPAELKMNEQGMDTNRPRRAAPVACSFCDGPAAPKGAVRGRTLWWCEACGVGFHADGEGR